MFNFINKKSTDADFQSKDSLILLEDNLSLNIKFKNNKKIKSKRVALNSNKLRFVNKRKRWFR